MPYICIINLNREAHVKLSKIMIAVNQVVFNKKGQKGTITRIITKSTGYVEVTLENGSVSKEMAFNLTDENGVSLKKAPVSKTSGMTRGDKKRYKDAASIAAFNALSPLEQAIRNLQVINGHIYGDRSSLGYQMAEEMYAGIEMKAKELNNDFIVSVCRSVIKYMKCSDKQAYILAKFVVENNIEL